MAPYITMFAITASLLFLCSKMVKHQAKYILALVFIIIICFAGFRGIVGIDTQAYLRVYGRLSDMDDFRIAISTMEPAFIALISLHKIIFDSEIAYIFMMSVFQAFLLYSVAINSSKKYTFLLCYIFLFYLNFHFNITRSAIATMLFLYGLCGKSIIMRRVALVFAPLFHLTILPYYLIMLTNLGVRYLAIVFSVLMVLIGLNLETIFIFLSKYMVYEKFGSESSSGVSIYGVVMVMMALSALYYMRKTSYLFRCMTAFHIISFVLIYFYPIGFRYSIMSSLFYFYFLIEEISKDKRLLTRIFFLAPLTLTFYLVLIGISNESISLKKRSIAGESVGEALDSTFIPYGFSWNDTRIKN